MHNCIFIVDVYIIILYTVHPRLSEQAELNLKTGCLDKLKIRIIKDDLLTLFHTP